MTQDNMTQEHMTQDRKTTVAKARIVDALARIHEAMLVQDDQEVTHSVSQMLVHDEPCAEIRKSNDEVDAAMRTALLSSEDAMIVALSSLPATAQDQATLPN